MSALIFGWMDLISFLKGNGINKKPIIIYIVFQVTISKWCIVNTTKSLKSTDFWNSLKLSSWIFKRMCLSFSFLYAINFDFPFPTRVSWYRWQEDLTWSCKDFETEKMWGASMLNVLIKNNSQITLYFGILSIFYWQNWLLHVKKTNFE